MDDNTERMRAVGQSEFYANQGEYQRLKKLADMILNQMEYHARQMDSWNLYLGALAVPTPADNVIPIMRSSDSHPDIPA
jgi:hypothetical protein